jgi:hypothetical protein
MEGELVVRDGRRMDDWVCKKNVRLSMEGEWVMGYGRRMRGWIWKENEWLVTE